MGVVLTPIITKDTIALDALRGRTLAVDGNGELYQFLALIRLRDGTPLRDSKGRITSHLSGLFYRITRLMADHGLRLVFVFDGEPPPLKAREIAKRRAGPAAVRRRACGRARARRPRHGLLEGDDDVAADAGDGGGGARAAAADGHPDRAGAVRRRSAGRAHGGASAQMWAAASKDYDSLLFGAPRLVRFLTISGKEFLPSQGTFRPIVPEMIVLERLLDGWGITREALVDLAILVGTDFNDGIKGIGPKKALALVQRYGRIEHMPDDIRDALGDAETLNAGAAASSCIPTSATRSTWIRASRISTASSGSCAKSASSVASASTPRSNARFASGRSGDRRPRDELPGIGDHASTVPSVSDRTRL